MKTLTVNNPKNSVKDSKAANKMLMGHNRFQHQTLWHVQHGEYTEESGKATVKMKFWLGYAKKDCTPKFGQPLADYLTHTSLTPMMTARRVARKIVKKTANKPYISPIKIPFKRSWIGGPGIGTHSWVVPPNNWQSDNAVDIACKKGTPLVAVADGTIGSKIGPLNSTDPHMLGIRFYLNDVHGRSWYYAHASKVYVKAGEHVQQGKTLALSGEANGVQHLHIAVDSGNPTQLLPK